MGLDMYLTATVSIPATQLPWEEEDSPRNALVSKAQEIERLAGMAEWPSSDFGYLTIKKQVGYWRKVNAVHGWFVRELADGVDECQEIWVSREKLAELGGLCRRVLVEKDPSLLQPTDGFFFGGTQIDDWYWDGIGYTADLVQHVLDETPKDVEFTYQASW